MNKLLFFLLLIAVEAGAAFRPAMPPVVTSNTRYVNAGANLYQTVSQTSAGTTIVVGPGLYTSGVTNLFKNGVNWNFVNGARIRLMDTPMATTGSGVFDDRFSGAVTSSVSGNVEIEWCSGTNIWVDPTDCNILGYNTNALGAIVVTNARTLINWTADTKLSVASVNGPGDALYVDNCATGTVFRTLSIFPLFTNGPINITSNCPADPGFQVTANAQSDGIWWALGTLDVVVDVAYLPGGYFIHGYNTSASDRFDMRVKANYADGKVYMVGASDGWRLWLDILELNRSNSYGNPGALDFFGGGRHYIKAQKVSSGLGSTADTGAVLNMVHTGSAVNSNLVVWVNIDKISGSNRLVRVQHGSLRGRIGHFQQEGNNQAVLPMISCTNATGSVSLSGELIESSLTSVGHFGGRTELYNYIIRSTNRDPVLVNASGLRLNSVTIIPGLLATNSIRGIGAQNVNFYGNNFAKSNSVNVTATVGALNVDSDVD